MHELRSIETIKRMHSFERDLMMTPSVNWMSPKDEWNYETVIEEVVEKLSIIDYIVELLLRDPQDVHIQEAIKLELFQENYQPIKEYTKFRSYLPSGRVQTQKDIIEIMSMVASGDEEYVADFNPVDTEIGIIKIQSEWQVNPKVFTIKIDGEDTEFNLQDAVKLYHSYLEASQNEFYKQAVMSKLDGFLERYWFSFNVASDLDSDESKGYFLVRPMTYARQYRKFAKIMDQIYYRRAHDYMIECKTLWEIFDNHEFLNNYTIHMSHIYPNLEKSN